MGAIVIVITCIIGGGTGEYLAYEKKMGSSVAAEWGLIGLLFGAAVGIAIDGFLHI